MYQAKYLLTPELIQKFNTSFNLDLKEDCKDFNVFIHIHEIKNQFDHYDFELIEIIRFLSYYDTKSFIDFCYYIYDKYLISDFIKEHSMPERYIQEFISKYNLNVSTNFEINKLMDNLKYRNYLKFYKPNEKAHEKIYEKYIKPEEDRELKKEIEKNKDKIRITICVNGFCKYDDKYTDTIEKNELWKELFIKTVKYLLYNDSTRREEKKYDISLEVRFI